MKIKSLILGLILALTCSWQSVQALELPEIIGDYMMLQQNTEVRIWGWVTGGSAVNVTTSWNHKMYTTIADRKTGKWEIMVKTPAASFDEQYININGDGELRVIEHILIGEVWFCSGQSNMEMPLRGFWNCPVEGANEAILNARDYTKSIRVATIQKVGAQEPQERVPGKWKQCTIENAADFTACGYFFAKTLTDLLHIPVGIINCSWGGSTVEGWMPKDTLMTYPDQLDPISKEEYHAKMIMFNGMLNPLAGYTIKGFLWNQGESNVGHAREYVRRFSSMVRIWRRLWRQPNDKLPIYTVELPPYWYDNDNGVDGALLREAQHTITRQLENSGCVCTADLAYDYEHKQIHGTKKYEIGKRLAYMAATRDYGIKGIEAEAPEFESMRIMDPEPAKMQVVGGAMVQQTPEEENQIVILKFRNARDGFSRLNDIEGFEAIGEDGEWHKAEVWADSDTQDPRINGCILKLKCPEAKGIKNIRYNFKNWDASNLYGMRGLPVVPFRTRY